ncbi:acetyl-CoA C-acetyltransferase [Thauera linaloolentis]|uniref:Acetyl-CoA acetyltransferase n=1 Tax=Thauera linaloolentis (strain DSM 12138 / JCM 21573 / CCUG 41526 / CIP 105981 / IAM 15112 / NBRC 102519 / 47Lol) TaxID=1123367 RepID=N6Y654_THAL4|nr:acetyl-CoA C-acetyltransferase [Thauera linaloolentis]ENO89691.1 acetyl-CoA acetyltransferase [Thauera linaloolentis 47Lol = DSM 12138]MCM8567171.1 acetyl-CoA C-acetyltransferase [Thauera linaloolentis]
MSGEVFIVDGARTPFLKARTGPGPFTAADLATAAGTALLLRQPFAPELLDEVILGCASPSADEVNIGRVVALRMGCGNAVPGWTVMRNCASGMQALDSAIANIRCGRSGLVLAGGVDALSHAPLLFSDKMVRWLAGWYAARTPGQKLAALKAFRPGHLAPVIGIMKGLTDPVVGQMMGQTAENLAFGFGITREEMDALAVDSHRRVAAAQDAGHYADEIVPLIGRDGTVFAADDGVRRDSSMAGLAKLKPFFDKKYGRVTAGNSSQISDGAAWLLLASAEAVERHGLRPLGRIVDSQWAGLAPEQMGLGPVHAVLPILQRHGLAPDDIDAWELNEAFAAQVIACLRAFGDDEYCRTHFGLESAPGAPDMARLNVDGGAVALGHPVGASGARIVLHLLHVLRRSGGRRGLASICIGGGQGGAMLVEAVQ